MSAVTSFVVCFPPENNIGAKGAKALAPELKRLTQLNTLGLEGNQ